MPSETTSHLFDFRYDFSGPNISNMSENLQFKGLSKDTCYDSSSVLPDSLFSLANKFGELSRHWNSGGSLDCEQGIVKRRIQYTDDVSG